VYSVMFLFLCNLIIPTCISCQALILAQTLKPLYNSAEKTKQKNPGLSFSAESIVLHSISVGNDVMNMTLRYTN